MVYKIVEAVEQPLLSVWIVPRDIQPNDPTIGDRSYCLFYPTIGYRFCLRHFLSMCYGNRWKQILTSSALYTLL